MKVEEFRSFLAVTDFVRILFVDDGSRDETAAVLEQICRGLEDRATVLRNPHNRGKAEAVRTGVVHALQTFEQEIIGFWDADLATPLEAVPGLVAILEQQPSVEMVFGARVQLLGRHVERSPARHYLGRVFATAVSVVLKLPIYDSQCGAKLFRANNDCASVFSTPFLSKWVFDVEILARYLNLHGREPKRLQEAIYEYPLEKWVDIAGSKVRPSDFVKGFTDIVKIKRRYL